MKLPTAQDTTADTSTQIPRSKTIFNSIELAPPQRPLEPWTGCSEPIPFESAHTLYLGWAKEKAMQAKLSEFTAAVLERTQFALR